MSGPLRFAGVREIERVVIEQPRDLVATEDYWRALFEQGEVAATTHAPLGDEFRAPGHARQAGDRATGSNGASAERDDRRDSLWAELDAWHHDGRTFRAPAIGCNKGGLLVRVRDSIAFLPASQLVDLPCSLGTDRLRADLEQMVGREFDLRLIELDRSRNRVICSERAATLIDDDLACRLDTLEAQVGAEVEGVVRSLCDFGVFVDLGGIDGLIHVSELGWQRVGHPSEILTVGQRVRVLVLSTDRDARRVALSLKRLDRNPWPLVAQRHAIGDVIDAVITNVVDFGAFAVVEEGVEGLIHISELADRPFNQPGDVVGEGQQVRVRVLHIDVDGRRLGLSLRQV
jgi:small subunit ribosomal protein S1